MGYFYNNLLESSITPPQSGIDLNCDPIDEYMVALSEAEYNFNLFMKELGIHELMEAAANDNSKNSNPTKFKSFIIKVEAWFRKMWEKISQIIGTIRISLSSKDCENFIANNFKSIKNGFENGEWSFTIPDPHKLVVNANEILKILKDGPVSAGSLKQGLSKKMTNAEIIKAVCEGKREADTIAKLIDSYTNIEKKTFNSNEHYISDAMEYIADKAGKRNEVLKKVRDIEIAVKTSYDESIKKLKELKDDEEAMNAVNNAKYAVNVISALGLACTKLIKTRYISMYIMVKAFAAADPNKKKE